MSNIYQIDEKTRIKFCRDYLFDIYSKYKLQRLYRGKWVTTCWTYATKSAGLGLEQVNEFSNIDDLIDELCNSENRNLRKKYTTSMDTSTPVWEQSND